MIRLSAWSVSTLRVAKLAVDTAMGQRGCRKYAHTKFVVHLQIMLVGVRSSCSLCLSADMPYTAKLKLCKLMEPELHPFRWHEISWFRRAKDTHYAY